MNLKEILSEAIKSIHLNDRVFDRLKSSNTNFSQESDGVKSLVFNNIKALEKINFPKSEDFAVLIYTSRNTYQYRKMTDKGKEYSIGNNIWVVTRDNTLITIVFCPPEKLPTTAKYGLKLDDIMKYIREYKHGDLNLTMQDINRIKNPNLNAPNKEVDNQQYIFNIQGVKYILAPNKEYLMKKNKPTDTIPIDNAFKYLDDKQSEALLDMI